MSAEKLTVPFYLHISESPDPLELHAVCGAKLESEFVPQYAETETSRICPHCLEQWRVRTEPGRTYVCLLFPAALLTKRGGRLITQ